MYKLDPSRIDLAREFMAVPYGLHSAELQELLNAMRRGPHKGRYAIFSSIPGKQWTLVQLAGERGGAVTFHPDITFASEEEAERHVFRLRWQAMTGKELLLDAGQ